MRAGWKPAGVALIGLLAAACAHTPPPETSVAVRDARLHVALGVDAGERAESDRVRAWWAEEEASLVELSTATEALVQSVRAGVPSTRSSTPEARAYLRTQIEAVEARVAAVDARWRHPDAVQLLSATRALLEGATALLDACDAAAFEDADVCYVGWPERVASWRRAAMALYSEASRAPMSVWGAPVAR